MNAEFLEQKIVVTEVDGQAVVTPARVRKGLDPKAFIGAEVIITGTTTSAASMIVSAKRGQTMIGLFTASSTSEPFFTYNTATGAILLMANPFASNEPGGH